jgi:hypothetical protein
VPFCATPDRVASRPQGKAVLWITSVDKLREIMGGLSTAPAVYRILPHLFNIARSYSKLPVSKLPASNKVVESSTISPAFELSTYRHKLTG